MSAEIQLRDYQSRLLPVVSNTIAADCLKWQPAPARPSHHLRNARLYERERRLAVIIAVPYQHLVDQ